MVKNYFQLIKKRKWMFLIVLAIFICIGSFNIFFSKKVYKKQFIIGSLDKFPLINTQLFTNLTNEFNSMYSTNGRNTESGNNIGFHLKKIEIIPNLKSFDNTEYFSNIVSIQVYDTTNANKIIKIYLTYLNNSIFVKTFFENNNERLLNLKQTTLDQIQKMESFEKDFLKDYSKQIMLTNNRKTISDLSITLSELDYKIEMNKGLVLMNYCQKCDFEISNKHNVLTLIIYVFFGLLIGFIAVIIIDKIEF